MIVVLIGFIKKKLVENIVTVAKLSLIRHKLNILKTQTICSMSGCIQLLVQYKRYHQYSVTTSFNFQCFVICNGLCTFPKTKTRILKTMSSLRIVIVNYFWSLLNVIFSITNFPILAFKRDLFLLPWKIFIQTSIR